MLISKQKFREIDKNIVYSQLSGDCFFKTICKKLFYFSGLPSQNINMNNITNVITLRILTVVLI